MSEIFNFLKKTEAERRKALAESAQTIASPVDQADGETSVPADIVIADPGGTERLELETNPGCRIPSEPKSNEPIAAAESIRAEIESAGGGKFDFSAADRQIRNVLDPLTMVGEQFRLLRSRLSLMQRHRGIRTVLITSTIPQEGKTFTAYGLAGVIAQEPGKRVILIDADMRKPGSGQGLGINGVGKSPGLSQVLRGEMAFHNVLLNSTNLEFYFMPSGPRPSNPSELLSSPNLERTIKIAAESFDWVIIDSPPVIGLADTTLLAPLCDAVLLVIRANTTPAKLITDTVQRIGRDRICGVVINRQKHIQSSRYYYSYYHRKSTQEKE